MRAPPENGWLPIGKAYLLNGWRYVVSRDGVPGIGLCANETIEGAQFVLTDVMGDEVYLPENAPHSPPQKIQY